MSDGREVERADYDHTHPILIGTEIYKDESGWWANFGDAATVRDRFTR